MSTGRQALSTLARPIPRGRAGRAWDKLRFPARLGVTAAVAAFVGVAGIIAAVVVAHSDSGSAHPRPAPVNVSPRSSAMMTERANAVPSVSAPGRQGNSNGSAQRAAVPVVLTAAVHRNCPAPELTGAC